MIPVQPQPEPTDFDAKVRQPGLSAIDELVGRKPRLKRPGPKRRRFAATEAEIPPGAFPDFWCEALNDLLTAYRRVCAYVSMYIEPVTGAATVDHFVPKSVDWRQVYEWSNYRLACKMANTNKGDRRVLDPFVIEDGWFALELVEFQVKPGEGLDDERASAVEETIGILKLNHEECRALREEYAEAYWDDGPDGISLGRLARRAPFVAHELRRQRRLNPVDMPATTASTAKPEVDG